MYELTLCHIYPDYMNLYADSGNLQILKKRMEWRGNSLKIVERSAGDRFEPKDLDEWDLFFIGHGTENDFYYVLQDFLDTKKETLCEALKQNKVVFAVGTGYQLLGTSYQTKDNRVLPCGNLLDFKTYHTSKRIRGNYLLKRTDGTLLSGYENHTFLTQRGTGVEPFAEVIVGTGNSLDGRTAKEDGIHCRNVFGTNCIGPALATSPAFADQLLELALQKKYPEVVLSPLDDTLEFQTLRYLYANEKG